MVVETELSPPPAVTVTSPKRSPYSRPSLERSSTWIEMKAGTRTTRGVMRPFSAVNRASVRAGSSSPAPPGSSSGDSAGSVSASGDCSVSVAAGASVSVPAVSVIAVVRGADAPSSSSPPHPETASTSAMSPAAANFTLNFRREMPIRESAESHNADAMDTR